MYNVHTMSDFEWDAVKARANLSKHAVDFADAATVFEDSNALTIQEMVGNEQRFITLALDAIGRTLVVVYTFRGSAIRIISARKSTPAEQRQYWNNQ